MRDSLPTVSIIIATLNAEKVLDACLHSISIQDYPKDKVEVIIGDGGSTDNTRTVAKKYKAKIIDNPLKTAESGKAAALKFVTGDFIALIDSDNILPTNTWLQEMLVPLVNHSDVIGSEPWKYTYRKQDGFIARYCALIGMNDPLVHFLGNYDRVNLLTGKWTEVPHEEKECGNYLLVTFSSSGVPTIGANGAVFRSDFLKQNVSGDHLFDIDIIAKELKTKGSVKFIKIKNGIIHTFCESSISKFIRKQKRRINDYIYHKSLGTREYAWEDKNIGGTKKLGLIKFSFYCLTIIPLFMQAIKGYSKRKDIAWFFHPIACEITFFVYLSGTIKSIFYKSESDRSTWRQ